MVSKGCVILSNKPLKKVHDIIANIGGKRNKKVKFIPINELRKIAFEKLKVKDERTKFTEADVKKIFEIIQVTKPQSKNYAGVISQIERDISVYIKPDALAMWLDADLGLAKDEPVLISNIAMRFLI